MSPDLRDRFRGALVGTAVGDALGAHFEGWPLVPDDELAAAEAATGEWAFTDDTHMTLVLARSVVEHGELVSEALAREFAQAWEAEPWRGYGAGPPQIFRRILKGEAWDRPAAEMFDGQGSFGNGAAMRAAPVALFGHPDVAAAVALARTQALVTHAHRLGIDGAGVQAAAVAVALAWDDPTDAARFVSAVAGHVAEPEFRERLERAGDIGPAAGPRDVAVALGNGIEAIEAVPAALACVVARPDSFAEAVRFAIRLGGDTDTIAAMAGAVAGALHGASAIPEPWRTRTEGTDELASLADRLSANSRP